MEMKKVEFSLEINAPKEKVWEALWKPENYGKWTQPFSPESASAIKGELKEGAEIQFLDSNNTGMFSEVKKLVPYEAMHFLHKGEVKDGQKQGESYGDDAFENYDLVEKDGKTELTAMSKFPEEYIREMAAAFPKALNIVKAIAEKNHH